MVDGHDSLHHHPHQWMQTLPRPLCKIRHILDQQILPSHILPSGKFISKDPLIHDVKSIIPFLSESQTAYFHSSKHLSLSSSTANTIQQHEPRDRVQSYVASDCTWECPLLCRQRFLHFLIVSILFDWSTFTTRNMLWPSDLPSEHPHPSCNFPRQVGPGKAGAQPNICDHCHLVVIITFS